MSLSRGARRLKNLLFEVYGQSVKIVEELYLGEGLRLDFFLPDYGLGFEFHGRQHEQFVEHFHKDAEGFRDSQRRDSRKLELCAQQGIALVVIWYYQDITKDLIIRASAEAFASFEPAGTLEERPRENETRRRERLDRARHARRQRYLWIKQRKKELQSSSE